MLLKKYLNALAAGLVFFAMAGCGQPKATGVKQFDALNSSFVINGQKVVLKDGLSKVPAAPGSASMVTTQYIGNVVYGDLTSDGKEDAAYFVMQDGGGSGQFYYVLAAINKQEGYTVTNAFLVGDRITGQSLRITSNELHVNFVGRDKNAPMTAPPSRPYVLLLKVSAEGVLEGLMK